MWNLEEEGKIVLTNSLNNLLILGQLLLFIIINIPLLVFMIKRIDKPIQDILKVLKKIKEGNFSEKLAFNTNNEFNQIKDSINQMSDELEKSRKLQENMEVQRNMLFANIAHDLKTPITTIQGFSKAIADGVVESEEKKDAYIRSIYSKSLLMNDLIDRMFEYVKLNSEQNILHFEETDLAELLRNCIAGIYSEFEDKDIELDIQIPDAAVKKNIDRLEIQRVFENLLNNILSHNYERIKVLVKMDNDGKVIVADSGTNIPQNIQAQLFTPFVNGDASRKSGHGSGLGLAISQKIMERHGRKINFTDSYPGYTKAFTIEF